MSGITSGEPQPGIRTYNPQVRVGNWNEDVCLEEDLMKGTMRTVHPQRILFENSSLLIEL